ncbi:hypothetical protein [Limosilactobacillus equigenerosi]|uniref:hypothetical protein n=1 Tax=Limosilactobacillus equigenerosi TaxID=417373 RepID=UPI000A9F3BFC|nr:hypothetical protein [Limosilactobacillus equigenerosi]
MLEAAAAYGIKNAIISHADEGLTAINQIYNEGKEKQEAFGKRPNQRRIVWGKI